MDACGSDELPKAPQAYRNVQRAVSPTCGGC